MHADRRIGISLFGKPSAGIGPSVLAIFALADSAVVRPEFLTLDEYKSVPVIQAAATGIFVVVMKADTVTSMKQQASLAADLARQK